MNKVEIKKLLFYYGLGLEEITKGLGLEKRSSIKRYARKQLKLQGQNLPKGFGWKIWTARWTLKKEQKVIKSYKETISIWKTAVRCKITCFEVACILNSMDLLFEEHEHKFRLRKVMTQSLLERLIQLVNSGKTVTQAIKELGGSRYWVVPELRGRVKARIYPEEQKQKAVSLYKKGIVPKDMYKYGITAKFCMIYRWIKKAGITNLIRKNTREDLRKLYVKNNFSETQWEVFSKLARKLTGVTYRKYQQEIDPLVIRGPDVHLDHKTSIYRAFLKGWTPDEAASKSNLRLIPERENRKKYTGSDVRVR